MTYICILHVYSTIALSTNPVNCLLSYRATRVTSSVQRRVPVVKYLYFAGYPDLGNFVGVHTFTCDCFSSHLFWPRRLPSGHMHTSCMHILVHSVPTMHTAECPHGSLSYNCFDDVYMYTKSGLPPRPALTEVRARTRMCSTHTHRTDIEWS